jgi:proteasome accessory factor C
VSEGGRTLAYERLRRLLFLVPFVSKNPGLPVDEVAKAVGITKDELLEELDLLTLVGRPPFSPDDFVDVYVEDDKVYVDLDQRLSAPPRLTAAEGVALAAAAATLKPPAGGTLAGALTKLETVLPPEARERYRQMARQLDVATGAPENITELTRAIVEHRELELDYAPLKGKDPEKRRVQPWELVSHRGHWYLSAFDCGRSAERLFRVDRIAQSRLLDERFTPPETAGRALPGSGPNEKPVQVRFSPTLAALQQERFGDAAQLGADGSVVVTVPGDSEQWLARWVLSFGGNATVISPEWAIRAVAEAARASLRSHVS